MKRKIVWLLALAVLLVFGVSQSSRQMEVRSLCVYTTQELIQPEALAAFQKKNDIRVDICVLPERVLLELLEHPYETIQATGSLPECDLILADADVLDQLIERDKLSALGSEKETLLSRVDESFLDMAFDPGNTYTIPVCWSSLGLISNSTSTDLRITDWSDLFRSELSGQVVMPDDQRELFALALMVGGADVNSTQESDVAAAAALLNTQTPIVLAYCSTEKMVQLFRENQATLAPCYAASAIKLIAANSDLSFVIPPSGGWSNLYSYAIPENATHQEESRLLLEFLCSTEVMARNAAYSAYSTVSPDAYALLDLTWQNNPLAYPDGIRAPKVFLDHLPDEVRSYRTFSAKTASR